MTGNTLVGRAIINGTDIYEFDVCPDGVFIQEYGIYEVVHIAYEGGPNPPQVRQHTVRSATGFIGVLPNGCDVTGFGSKNVAAVCKECNEQFNLGVNIISGATDLGGNFIPLNCNNDIGRFDSITYLYDRWYVTISSGDFILIGLEYEEEPVVQIQCIDNNDECLCDTASMLNTQVTYLENIIAA